MHQALFSTNWPNNPLNNPAPWVNQGTERLSNLPEDTQLIGGVLALGSVSLPHDTIAPSQGQPSAHLMTVGGNQPWPFLTFLSLAVTLGSLRHRAPNSRHLPLHGASQGLCFPPHPISGDQWTVSSSSAAVSGASPCCLCPRGCSESRSGPRSA